MNKPILDSQSLQVNQDDELDSISIDKTNLSFKYNIATNALIRDRSISPGCRWLIICLLSKNTGQKINIQQVINNCKHYMDQDKVYSLFNEAIEAGYIKIEHFDGGSNE